MQLAQHRFALSPRRFGRGPVWITEAPPQPASFRLSDDVKLFASTFAGGFLFVSLLLA
jgi:hypothetical protein